VQPNVIREAGRFPDTPDVNVLGQGRSARLAASSKAALGRSTARLGRAGLPGISGRWSALVLLGLFIASAVLVPIALHRSLWVEAEVVLALWFLIWTVALTWLGYAGRAVEQDWGPYRNLWERLGRQGRAPGDRAAEGDPWWSAGWSFPDFGSVDAGAGGEGCLMAIVALLVIAVAGVVLYFTIGWVVPAVAFALYALVRSILNRVGDHSDETRGDSVRALTRGVLWAAIYTGPLTIVVWAIHALA
jgi:hypothetical protein